MTEAEAFWIPSSWQRHFQHTLGSLHKRKNKESADGSFFKKKATILFLGYQNRVSQSLAITYCLIFSVRRCGGFTSRFVAEERRWMKKRLVGACW